jgi:hypothetical protein
VSGIENSGVVGATKRRLRPLTWTRPGFEQSFGLTLHNCNI